MAAAPLDPPRGHDQNSRGVLEHLAGLDLKLDRLSRQMEECLSGVHGLAGVKYQAIHAQCSTDSEPPQDSCVGAHFMLHLAQQDSGAGSHLVLKTPEGGQYAAQQDENLFLSQRSANSSKRVTAPVWRSTRALSAATDEAMLHSRRSIGPLQLKVWKFMSNPESSFASRLYNRLNSTFILVAVLLNMIQGTSLQILSPDTYMGVECSIEALFLLEISALFAFCPYRKYFLLRFYNIIDILSALPLALRVYKITTGGRGEIYAVIFEGLVPVVRLLKAVRHFQTSRLLANAFILAREAVPVLVFYYAVVWLLFTTIIYAVEARSNIPSLPDAMWLTVVTMTTVGYGDLIPVTAAGRMAVSVLVLVSTLYMAIPLGIIGSCFSAVWDDRDKILLFERLRTCFMEAGCSDLDVPRLFSRFDKTKTGSLDALEFNRMCTSLKLGLSEERLMMLFNFWADEDGRIAATTFQHILFPKDCLKILEQQAQEQANAMRRRVGGPITPKSEVAYLHSG